MGDGRWEGTVTQTEREGEDVGTGRAREERAVGPWPPSLLAVS